MLYMRSRYIFKNFKLSPTDPHDPYFAESFSVVNVIFYPFQERTFSSIHALLIKHAFEKVIRPIIILKSFLQLSRIILGVFLSSTSISISEDYSNLQILPFRHFSRSLKLNNQEFLLNAITVFIDLRLKV